MFVIFFKNRIMWHSQSILQAILILCNQLSAVEIENLVVPDLIQIGNVSEIILDCQFSNISAEERLLLRWFHNGSEKPIYQWRPGTSPRVSGILIGRLDLTFRISSSTPYQGRALRIIRLGPELAGEYSCSIEHNGTEVRQTKPMLIFSPEQDFDLKIYQKNLNIYEVKCTVRGVFPPPLLLFEHKNEEIPKQQQRVWRNGDELSLYDAESTARVRADAACARVACRLLVPEAGYTAKQEKTLPTLQRCTNQADSRQISAVLVGLCLLAAVNIQIS